MIREVQVDILEKLEDGLESFHLVRLATPQEIAEHDYSVQAEDGRCFIVYVEIGPGLAYVDTLAHAYEWLLEFEKHPEHFE